jgi:hypothetical protein
MRKRFLVTAKIAAVLGIAAAAVFVAGVIYSLESL